MVSLQTFGNSSVKFTFLNNALYLNNGEITVPLNSLMLVIDESELATFKKLNGDPFVSVSYADLGMDKDELEQWYKDNMVGGTGGSSSGLTPSDVQDMIDASISGYDEDIQDEIGEKEQVIAIALTELKNDKLDVSAYTPTDLSEYWTSGETQSAINAAVSGKADTSAVTEAIDAAVSGKVDTSAYTAYTAATDATLATKADKNEIPSVSGYADSVEYNSTTKYVNFYHGGTGGTVVYSFNAAPFVIDGMVQDVVISGGSLVISFNTDAGKQDISIPLTEIFDPANYYDKTATDAAINAAVSGKVDTSTYEAYTAATNARLGEDEEVTAAALNALEDELANKQDALVAGDNITISGNVISADGGGKAVSAGTNISVTTGETADTINCTLPITATTNGSTKFGSYNNIDDCYSFFTIGDYNTLTKGSTWSDNTHQFAIGSNNKIKGAENYIFGRLNRTLEDNTKYFTKTYVFGQNNLLRAKGTSDNSRVFLIGYANDSNSKNSVYAFGDGNIFNNNIEFSIGKNNSSVSDGTESGNTFFSVGNGTSNSARHNAFEIKQNGDIYISSGGTDIKLQDYLGGGSVTIDQTLDSGSTNAVANSAITTAFNNIEDRLGEDEEVTAAALNALNDGINSVNDKFGGLRIVKLSQQEYDALVTKDNNTMYVVV